MLCDHSGNYGRLERGRTEQGSEKMTIAKRLYTGVMPDKTASRLIKRIRKRKKSQIPFDLGEQACYDSNIFSDDTDYILERTDWRLL